EDAPAGARRAALRGARRRGGGNDGARPGADGGRDGSACPAGRGDRHRRELAGVQVKEYRVGGGSGGREMPAAEWDDIVGGPDAGRDADGRPTFVVGIVGDSGSGKTTVAEAIAELLGRDRVSDLRLDDYHKF